MLLLQVMWDTSATRDPAPHYSQVRAGSLCYMSQEKKFDSTSRQELHYNIYTQDLCQHDCHAESI
eukprot:15336145-Ditylum_brightwellii.AAC.1